MTNWNSFFEGILDSKQVKINEPMKRHTTYGIGGTADVFVTPFEIEELREILKKAHENSIKVSIIGGGSNTLVSDKGIRGITICTGRLKPSMECEDTFIIAKGGVGTGGVARFALKNSLSGFEWAVGIPGTLCGAVFMNANGYGGQMKKVVQEVYAISRDGKEMKTYDWDDLKYGDSDSVFMHNGDIIIGAKLHLKKGNKEEIDAKMKEYQASRRKKQPLDKRSAGTMYLRPPGYYVGPMIKASGLAGFSIGDAQVSEKHQGFVVNNGKATCQDVVEVLKHVRKTVKEKFKIKIGIDVRVIGEDTEQLR